MNSPKNTLISSIVTEIQANDPTCKYYRVDGQVLEDALHAIIFYRSALATISNAKINNTDLDYNVKYAKKILGES